jgi:predicted short-subunit dehydrogenase-like oxidoreductase (DUF2520 family)
MLLPLMRGALDNVAATGAPAALTGPVRRGDAGTVALHLEALAFAPLADAAYRALARAALDLARRADPPLAPAAVAELQAQLGEPTAR